MEKLTIFENHSRRTLIAGVLAGLALVLAFALGFLFHELVGPQSVLASVVQASSTSRYPLLDEVQTLLDAHYLRPQPDNTTRQYAAIRGVLSALGDRYTFFIEPPVAQSESDVLAGTYGGIGVIVQRSEMGEFVLYPFPDSPAVRSGIENGDILHAVNGRRLELTDQQDAVDQMLRGEVKDGNGVELTVAKSTSGEDITVFIPFEVINVPSVLWRILAEDPRLGYIQILNFTNRTPDELLEALKGLREAAIKGLVLDLRNNRGGLLQESIQIASEFLDSGVVVYETEAQSERAHEVVPGGHALDWPLVVLVNHESASAAELVAAAIKDHERGIIVGQTTFGKGTVQQIFRLSDESSVHITSAEFFTPNHTELEGKGLEPSISMIPDENGRDVEIGEAIRQLQQKLTSQDKTAP